MTRIPALLLLAALIGPCIGCSDGYAVDPGHVKTVPASGTLTWEGRPLESYQVSFIPEAAARGSSGITDAEGRFTLATNRAGDGAPPGRHRVSIVYVPPEMDSVNQGPLEDPALLPKPPVELPAKYANPETSGIVQDVPPDGSTDLKIELP